MDNTFSQVSSNHRHKRQCCGLHAAAIYLALILSTTALAQSGETDKLPYLPPMPPYLTIVNGWLQTEVADARKAQTGNQNTLDACLALLDKARSAQNATAVAAAQRAVNTAEEGLRKNRLREQRALKAISWVERLRKEGNSSAKVAGFMPRIEGTVEIQSAGGGAVRSVTGDTPPVLGSGDTLRTGKDGHADILLDEGGMLSLDAGSALILSEKGAEVLLYGEILSRVRRKFEIRTPAAICGIRGTEFVLREIPGKPTALIVIDGTVAFSDIKGVKTVLVGAGQQSYILSDGSPAEPTKANLQEMKKWWEE
jgi:ferric-dicitrate binding protein FerR (iron transport regulator)